MKNNIMIYQDEDGITKGLLWRFVNEDIWLTQNQIADIYKTTQLKHKSTHINLIYMKDTRIREKIQLTKEIFVSSKKKK